MFNVTAEKYDIAYTFIHTRDVNFVIRPNKVVTDVTSCRLVVNKEEFYSTTACVSGDAFNKSKGRKIALAKALKEAQIPKSTRTVLWADYFKRGCK